MNKSAGMLTGFLFIFCVLHAQHKPSKLFAEISIGPSIPLGQFAEKSYDGPTEKDQPGMAGVGQSINVLLGYYLKENAGLLLTAGYSSNKQKPDGYSAYAQNLWYSNTARVDAETNSWKILKVMAGGFLVTPLAEDKLNLITKLSAGICKTDIPAYGWTAYSLSTGTAIAMHSQDKEKLAAAFCYQISLGLQYKLNERLHLLVDINSFNATAQKDITFTTGSPISSMPGPTTTVNRKFKLGSVNALLGLGLSF
jgi:hypothetical protein